MCDRSSDPTEHAAARERPSALDDTTEATLAHIAWAQHARSEHEATHGEAEQCGEACIVLGLAEFDDEGTGMKRVLMSNELFDALGASKVEWGEPDAEGFYTPAVYADTTEATLRDARHPCPCGRRTVEIAPGIGICERDHVWDGYVGLTKRAEVALAVALRAALQQPAVQPEYEPLVPNEQLPDGWAEDAVATGMQRGPRAKGDPE